MRTRLISLLSGLLLAFLATAFLVAPGAGAATDAPAASGPQAVGEALKKSPVYVDPRAAGQLSASEAGALAKKIKDADKPLFVAVLPANAQFPASDVLRDVRTETGVTGLYAIRLGDGFNAGADASVMPGRAVGNLTDAVKAGGPVDAATELNNFVDQALPQVRGQAPASWDTGSGSGGAGSSSTGLIVLGSVVVLGGAGAYTVARVNRRKRDERTREALEKLRVVVDEDITAFGEELDRLDFHPGEPGADDAMRADYERSLDSYEKAKSLMGAAERPEDVRGVTEALEDGRFALAMLAARRTGAPLPERRSPCFFDPRHGPSVTDAEWAPPAGVRRTVPVCAADAARLADGADPQTRTVETEHGRRPYWEAGPAYGPWAGGYFGGGLLPGLLVGTMLGSMMATPAYAADFGGGDPSGFGGGDYSGSDFDPGDFGGGGFGGGGDFGGGGGFDGGGGGF
ncbi:putative membrane protein [Streptomyces sp. L-9-10]|uniref:hypothetical protein n=1 Tax=Streptomyces sp. L-9-10 TaxID=1478131 RepID=UPI00101D42C9|nr:hypothetical protein [Streptomyces sp. L-9-10]RYJ22978.1 putative membrane protein [Streptomyces sp. L-9-10]